MRRRGSDLKLDTVHRFTRTETTADGATRAGVDDEYAQLSLAMRSGADPDAVFDALLARDQIRVHKTDDQRLSALTAGAVDALAQDSSAAIVADTNEQVAALNAAIRDRLVDVGRVDNAHANEHERAPAHRAGRLEWSNAVRAIR